MGVQLSTLLQRLGVGGAVPGAGRVPCAAPASTDVPERVGDLWSSLTRPERAAVLDPVGVLGRAGRQTDGTTCGSAVLVMTAALGDPVLAAWLASGRLADGAARPPELAEAPPSALRALSGAPSAQRFAVLQRVVKRRTNARALLGVAPWPAALGTPPWGAARVARFPGVRYRSVVVDDTDRPHIERVLELIGSAVAVGVPIPLYSGGDSSMGWSTAVPRHVVLAVGGDDERLDVWEPSVGRRHQVTRAELLAGAGQRALGGWPHLVWALLAEGAR